MNFSLTRLVMLAGLLLGYSFAFSQSHFKKLYRPDTTVLQLPSFFTGAKLMETDLPGREIALAGSVSTSDSGNVPRSAIFNLLCDLDGTPVDFHLFEDTSQFVFQAPRTYGACYDGNGDFYFGVGANSKQVIVRANAAGQMVWATAGNHHEYYSLICEGGQVSFLGQDESFQGAHDFSLARFDANGGGGNGTMFGTVEFELPQKMAKIHNQYVMVGSSFQAGAFKGLIVKANSNMESVWGHIIDVPGKSILIFNVDQPLDGDGYIFSGRARGGADSLFLMKTDTSGNPIWTKFYGLTGATEVYNTAMAIDPVSGSYLLSGYYRGQQYSRPFILKTDSDGLVDWALDYGESGNNTDETLNDIIYSSQEEAFFAAGDMVAIDGNQFNHWLIMLKIAADSGSVGCDSALSFVSQAKTAQIVGTTFEEPFLWNSHFPFGTLINAEMSYEARCTVLVGLAEGLPATGVFDIVNPSSSTLRIKAEIPAAGAALQVTTMTGEVVLQAWLDEGMQSTSFDLPQLASGIYLVSLAGEQWRYPTKRWVVQR